MQTQPPHLEAQKEEMRIGYAPEGVRAYQIHQEQLREFDTRLESMRLQQPRTFKFSAPLHENRKSRRQKK